MGAERDRPLRLRWRVADWAAILIASALLRVLVAFVALGAMPLAGDAGDYFTAALRLTSGDAGVPFYWPPGESLALAAGFGLLGPSLALARWITVAMSTATVAFTMLLARDLAGASTARTAGWMAAVYSPAVLLCGQPCAQHLAALCLAAAAHFAMRAARATRPLPFLATGMALGLGCLARPSMASVAPVIGAAWAVAAHRTPASRRAIAIGAAAAACVAFACVVPVCAHNHRAGAGWTISTNNERNLFLGNNPYTPDYKTSHLGQRPLEELDPGARRYLASFYARPDARAAMGRAALAYMAEHPARTALRTLNRATSFWGFDYLASREIQKWRGGRAGAAAAERARTPERTSLAGWVVLGLEAGGYLAMAALALVALFGQRRQGAGDGPTRAWLLALVFAYELPYTLAFSGGTYHFPVVPLLLPLAAIAAGQRRDAWRNLRRGGPACWALGAFAVLQAQYAYHAIAMR